MALQRRTCSADVKEAKTGGVIIGFTHEQLDQLLSSHLTPECFSRSLTDLFKGTKGARAAPHRIHEGAVTCGINADLWEPLVSVWLLLCPLLVMLPSRRHFESTGS